MVMLMIKFGAYKAACCWVCAPSFRADNKTYDEEMSWAASEKRKRKRLTRRTRTRVNSLARTSQKSIIHWWWIGQVLWYVCAHMVSRK